VPGAPGPARLVSRPVPRRLRPKTELAADAILVGDPGRSLLLAQELLAEPKMSNHARGLWGYTGRTPAGDELTIQATGMGGPSAALVLTDLAKLGVRRVVRVGTCVAAAGRAELSDLLLPSKVIAAKGSAAAFGLQEGAVVEPDAELLDCLREEVEAQDAVIASLDTLDSSIPGEAIATDMQTVAVFARARQLEIPAAALLVVNEEGDQRIDDENLDDASKRAGQAAMKGLSR
jgi:purine-nucleoside phosphorylase